jgi:photosystem II stability/assembly factor-like uncharacterized protein
MQGGGKESCRENLPLFDLAADGRGQLWAVGDQGRVTQFDGSRWLEHDSGTSANLRAVLPLTNGEVLVSGSGGTVIRFRDGRWSTEDTPTGCPLVSMADLGDDNIMAVGGEYDVDRACFAGRLFLGADGDWHEIESEQHLPRLRRVRRHGDTLVICGDDGTAFRWTAEGARRLHCPVRHDLHDILFESDGSALICGDGGTLLYETELSQQAQQSSSSAPPCWQRISNGETRRTLRAIWPLGDGKLIAAGDGGAILHIDGSQVQARVAPGGLRVHALWGSSPKHVFAACDRATILHFDGDTWTTAHRGDQDTALLAITGFGPHDIFAVGDGGYALRYDGLMWRRLETGVQQELYGLWGQDSKHLLAVGSGGLVLRFNGEHWKAFSAGTDHDLYAVTGSGLEKLFLAGLNGALVRYEDDAWHRDFSGTRSDLHALAVGDQACYAAGSSGTVLKNADGIWELERTGCTDTLQALAVTATGVYAAGSGGTILRRRPGQR